MFFAPRVHNEIEDTGAVSVTEALKVLYLESIRYGLRTLCLDATIVHVERRDCIVHLSAQYDMVIAPITSVFQYIVGEQHA